jgi:hypothetical protein
MKKYLFAGMILILAGVFAFDLLLENVWERFGFVQIADFENMPADDKDLKKWLCVQPGVVPESVWISRRGRSLLVGFSIDRNLNGRPAVPNLDGKCKSLGYGGPNSAFRDCPLPVFRDEQRE